MQCSDLVLGNIYWLDKHWNTTAGCLGRLRTRAFAGEFHRFSNVRAPTPTLIATCFCFSEKEDIFGKADDYAHEKVGFLTWHRLFLLWFEREIQIELNKPNFRLYYWDWRGRADIENLLKEDRFGRSTNGYVTGNFEDDWKTVCWEIVPTVENCDPDATYNVHDTLRRCPTEDNCFSSNSISLWPSKEDVNVAVGKGTFDSSPYNTKAASGLRNYLEGFKPVSNCPMEKPDESPLCNKEKGGERLLHNVVSHYIYTTNSFIYTLLVCG